MIFFRYLKTFAFLLYSVVILVHLLVFHIFISLFNILIKFIFRCHFVFVVVEALEVLSFRSYFCVCIANCLEQKGVIDTK